MDGAESSATAESQEAGRERSRNNGAVDLLKQQFELEIQAAVAKQSEDLLTEGHKEATAMKIEDEVRPPLRQRGMALGYVAP